MRILQLCNKAPYPANDGSSIAIANLAEGFIEHGIELHMLPINTKKHFKPESAIPDRFKQLAHYRSVYKNTNVSIIGAFINLFSKHSYFVSRFFFKAYREKLIETLKHTEFDIVQLEGVFMASYISTIKQHAKAKIILRAHNIEHQIWDRHLKHETNRLKKYYLHIQNNRLKTFELMAFRQVDAIVTITDEDKKKMQLLVPDAIVHTCLTGVNLNHYQPVLAAIQPDTLFHFASMDWMPNVEAVDWLLEYVWPQVKNRLPSTRLVLAGRGMPERFKKLASDRLIVIDAVENAKMFYHHYNIMLAPLWSGSGLRIKLVEGLAYGKAIVTTTIGAEGIPYTTSKELIIADTAMEFIDAIVSVMTNQEQQQALQQEARSLAECYFNYKSIASNLLAFYRSILTQPAYFGAKNDF